MSTERQNADDREVKLMRFKRCVATVFVLAAVMGALSTQAQTNTFTVTGSMISARYYHTMTLLQSGLVLVTGGCKSGSNCLTSAELYNPSTGAFAVTGSMSVKRWGHTATLLQNGTVLIAGGCTGDGLCNASAEIYNPSTGAFTLTGPMSTRRYQHTATLLQDGTVLVTGGCTDGGTCFSSAEIYNPVTGTFSLTAGSMSVRRYEHTAALLDNGEVLVSGGCTGSGSCNSSADLYNPLTGAFTPTGAMTAKRYTQTATLLGDGTVLTAGGCTGGGSCLSSAEIYNATTGAFTATGSMSAARYQHTATLLQDGTVLTTGGCTGSGSCLSSAELYSPMTKTYSVTGSMSTKRYTHAAAMLQDGTVLVSGGCTGGGTCLASAEVYHPEPPQSGYVNPKYIVVGVTYAPPGPSSFAQYGTSTMVGSTNNVSSSFSDAVSQSISVTHKGFLGFAGGKITSTSSTTSTQTSGTSHSVTVSAQNSTSDKTPGTGNAFSPVNHDYDLIWVWLNPVALFSTYPNGELTWTGYGYDTNDGPELDIYALPVGNIRCAIGASNCNPSFGGFNSSALQEIARAWAAGETFPAGQGPGLTTADLTNILNADPWGPNTSYSVMLGPGSPATTTDGRFTISGGVNGVFTDFPYEQALPGGQPQSSTYGNTYSQTTTTGQTASYQYKVMFGTDISFSGSGWLSSFSFDLKDSNTMTWTSQYQNTLTNNITQTDTTTIVGPTCTGSPCNPAYSGPPEFDVYQDNLYGTFMFYPQN